jgi:hypothetical protein
LGKLKLKRGRFLDALGDYRDELEGEEENGGAQRLARRLYRLLGRLAGGGSEESGEKPQESD